MRWRRPRRTDVEVDLSVRLGPLRLANPVVAASGTFGHGAEFAAACPPHELGAVTVKSLAHFAHDGNPPRRVTETPGGGMLNSVGLAGPGVTAWIERDLPALEFFDARVIVSLWGRVVDDYAKAAALLAPVASRIVAVEVNLSCPNLAGHEMFAQSVEATADAVRAVVGELRGGAGPPPVFAKLTAQVTDIVIVAGAALGAGATGLTLINTLPGLMVDIDHRRPVLGGGGGGLSGPPILPVALRIVGEVARAHPGVPIIGTGGVTSGEDAAAMLLAGASAVGVGTATFADARATLHVRDELTQWCRRHRVTRVAELIGRLEWPR